MKKGGKTKAKPAAKRKKTVSAGKVRDLRARKNPTGGGSSREEAKK